MVKRNYPKNTTSQRGIVFSAVIIVGILVVVLALIGAYVLSRAPKNSPAIARNTQTNTTKVVEGPKTAAKDGMLDIKEYGVAVPLSADLNGLTYVAETNPQKTLIIINLKLDSFTDLANKCVGSPKGTPQTLAALIKTKGQYDPKQDPNAKLLKQFNDFYISLIGGSLPAKLKCKDPSVQTQYDALYDKLQGALASSFANANVTS